jgi:hypothetical protein
MATPKTINQLTERSGALQATDEIEVQVSGETKTKKKALSAVKTLVIGSATVGGNAAGDIVTTNGTQTLTNKTLTSPTVGTACTLPAATTIGTVAAAEILKLAGLTPTTTELNYVDGVTSSIQTQLNTLAALIPSYTTQVRNYGLTFTASGSDRTLSQHDIMDALGLDKANYVIDPTSMHGTLASVSGGTYTVIDDSATSPPNEAVAWTTARPSGQNLQLNELKISGLTNGVQYNVAFSFTLSNKLTGA